MQNLGEKSSRKKRKQSNCVVTYFDIESLISKYKEHNDLYKSDFASLRYFYKFLNSYNIKLPPSLLNFEEPLEFFKKLKDSDSIIPKNNYSDILKIVTACFTTKMSVENTFEDFSNIQISRIETYLCFLNKFNTVSEAYNNDICILLKKQSSSCDWNFIKNLDFNSKLELLFSNSNKYPENRKLLSKFKKEFKKYEI